MTIVIVPSLSGKLSCPSIFLKKFWLKVHKIEIFFGFDFEICIISLLVTSKY